MYACNGEVKWGVTPLELFYQNCLQSEILIWYSDKNYSEILHKEQKFRDAICFPVS